MTVGSVWGRWGECDDGGESVRTVGRVWGWWK